MRTRLLQLPNGEKDFAICKTEFAALFPSGATTDVLNNKITFEPDACHHVCYKPEDKRRNKGPRTEWEQERAERLLWIKDALTAPKHIRFAPGEYWAYLLEVPGDRENNLSPELYVVIAEPRGATPRSRGALQFKTGHPTTKKEWDDYKKTRPWIYPDFGQEKPITSGKNKPKK